MAFYFLILFGFYFALLLVLRIGWSKAIVKKEINSTGKAHFISVIIPVRNEEKNIGTLLESLRTQDYYLRSNFEVIVVDDHSTDGSLEKCKGHIQNLTSFSLGADENGKKAALTYGIKHAKGEVIATTDADCLLPSDWLTTINSVFQDEQINM